MSYRMSILGWNLNGDRFQLCFDHILRVSHTWDLKLAGILTVSSVTKSPTLSTIDFYEVPDHRFNLETGFI